MKTLRGGGGSIGRKGDYAVIVTTIMPDVAWDSSQASGILPVIVPQESLPQHIALDSESSYVIIHITYLRGAGHAAT